MKHSRRGAWRLAGEVVHAQGSKWSWRGVVCQLYERPLPGFARLMTKKPGQALAVTVEVFRHRNDALNAAADIWRARRAQENT